MMWMALTPSHSYTGDVAAQEIRDADQVRAVRLGDLRGVEKRILMHQCHPWDNHTGGLRCVMTIPIPTQHSRPVGLTSLL